MAEKVEALHQEYASLRKLNPERRSDNPKMKLFQEKLQNTMPFWHRDVEKRMEGSKNGKNEVEKIAIDEDIAFLKSMMTDRVASYCSQDKVTLKLEEKRLLRATQEEARSRKEEERKLTEASPSVIEYSEAEEEDIHDLEHSTPKRSHKRRVKTGTTIFIPHDVLKAPELVSTTTRNKITPTAMSACLHSLISACKGDTSAVNLHYSTAYR